MNQFSFSAGCDDGDDEQFEKLPKYRIRAELLLGRLRFPECVYYLKA